MSNVLACLFVCLSVGLLVEEATINRNSRVLRESAEKGGERGRGRGRGTRTRKEKSQSVVEELFDADITWYI